MKKYLFLFALILSATFSKATNFTLVIATTDTAYAHWYNSTAAVTADTAAITALGLRPVAPIFDSTGSNHSTWATAAASWDVSFTALQDSLAIHIATNRTNELLLLTTIGYQTAFTNTPVNQWIQVSGNSFPTVWIGYYINTSAIIVLTTKPTRAFPYH